MNAVGSVCCGNNVRLDAHTGIVLSRRAEDCKYMKRTSCGRVGQCGYISGTRARIAATRIAAGSLVAGLLVGLASFGGAHVGECGRRSSSKPAPRAFFGLGPATKGKIDGRPYFIWGASPGSYLSDRGRAGQLRREPGDHHGLRDQCGEHTARRNWLPAAGEGSWQPCRVGQAAHAAWLADDPPCAAQQSYRAGDGGLPEERAARRSCRRRSSRA